MYCERKEKNSLKYELSPHVCHVKHEAVILQLCLQFCD
jgi:hypothetical protein